MATLAGDGYMDSYAALLAHAPWAPGFGKQERPAIPL